MAERWSSACLLQITPIPRKLSVNSESTKSSHPMRDVGKGQLFLISRPTVQKTFLWAIFDTHMIGHSPLNHHKGHFSVVTWYTHPPQTSFHFSDQPIHHRHPSASLHVGSLTFGFTYCPLFWVNKGWVATQTPEQSLVLCDLVEWFSQG